MTDPHRGQPVERAGASLSDAAAGVVLVHGRGARARGMLGLAAEFGRDDVAYLAPQAARGTWYPNSFMAPIESNEPHLSSALDAVGDVVAQFEDAGIAADRVLLAGFSQGACLASEFVARNARRYGGLAAFSGGLVGPEGTPREYDGSLDGTPVFLGCDDSDPHIPVERVHETRDTLAEMDADVTENIYQGIGHGIVADEIDHVREVVADL